MRSALLVFSICILLSLALCTLPVSADDCGCNSGWDDDNDDGASDSGGQDSGAESGDEGDSSGDWDVTDSSWYSELGGGDDPDTEGSSESSDSSDYSGDSGSSGTTVADGSADDAQVWYTRAREYYIQGLYNESLEAFNRSLSLDPFNKNVWMRKGELLMEIGYFQAAGDAYQRVIKLDPAEYEAYFLAGEAFFHMDLFEDSIAMYDKALAANPQFDSALRQKGLAREALALMSAEPDIIKEESSDNIGGESSEVADKPGITAAPEEIATAPTTLPVSAGIMPHHILFGVCILSFLAMLYQEKR
jgi:tetratricopeptide (TPR) repeat protein